MKKTITGTIEEINEQLKPFKGKYKIISEDKDIINGRMVFTFKIETEEPELEITW